MRPETEQTIYPKDYAPTAYKVGRVELDVHIAPETSRVRALLTIVPREGTEPGTPLVLDGDDLTLMSIAIDGRPLGAVEYTPSNTELTIVEPPAKSFIREPEFRLEPEKNTRLMGFYRSSGTWCTRCEPEGFRRITYYPDRPDILAPFKVTMTADKTVAPVLLANGNLVETGEIDGNLHYAIWDDPFPKPSYLFAMVAGDLGSIHDNFIPASGRSVALGVY